MSAQVAKHSSYIGVRLTLSSDRYSLVVELDVVPVNACC